MQSSAMTQVPQSLQNGAGCIKVVSGSGFRYLVPFPYKLHKMLEETEQKGEAYTSIVSWLPDGLHFRVHDSSAFMKHVVPQFFKQKSYKSFQRQLHIYGFKRILKGDLQGAFHHPKFIKGDRELTHKIDRIKAPVPRKNARPSMEMVQSKLGTRTPKSRSTPQNDTLEWLMSSGMKFSDLEPSCVSDQGVHKRDETQVEESHSYSSTLLSQADQISSLFSPLIKQESSRKSSRKSSSLLSTSSSTKENIDLFTALKKPRQSSSVSSPMDHNTDMTDQNNLQMDSLFSSILCPPPSNEEAKFTFSPNPSYNPSMFEFEAV